MEQGSHFKMQLPLYDMTGNNAPLPLGEGPALVVHVHHFDVAGLRPTHVAKIVDLIPHPGLMV